MNSAIQHRFETLSGPLAGSVALMLTLVFGVSMLGTIPALSQTPALSRTLAIDCTPDSTYGFALERLVPGTAALGGPFSDSINVDGVRLTSRGLSDGFICSVDDELRLQWLRNYGGPGYDAITCMTALPDGGLAVGMLCGAGVDGFTTYRIGDKTLTGRGGADAVVFVLNADGSVRWVRNDGGINAEYPTTIAVLDDSLIVVSGVFLQSSRFGTETISDSAEISGYVQAISLSGSHRWVRVIRGAGLSSSPLAVRIEPLHCSTYTAGRVDVVVRSSEAIAWGDVARVGRDAENYGTTAVVQASAGGLELGFDGITNCLSAQTVYGHSTESIVSASAENAFDACTSLPFDVIAFRTAARTTSANRIAVNRPNVHTSHNTAHGHLISGSTEELALLLALESQGNERWRYVYTASQSSTMYNAIETDTSVIAVALADTLMLLRLDLPTGISDDASTMSAQNSNTSEPKIVYYSELPALLEQGYTLASLTGAFQSPFGSEPLAPQVLALLHYGQMPTLILLMP